MADMTDLSGHSYGRRPTRVMSTGWDGNLGLNQAGAKNVRESSNIQFGDNGCGMESFEPVVYFDNDENTSRDLASPPWYRGDRTQGSSTGDDD